MKLKERKIHPKWKAQANGGILYVEREADFRDYLLSLQGKDLQVVVKKYVKSRSRQEEKFYHAVVVRMVAEAMSIDDNEAHYFLKSLFLTEEVRAGNGKYRFKRTLSTTELDDKSYREYWEKCIRWAALPTNPAGLSEQSGLELYIPYPNECEWENY